MANKKGNHTINTINAYTIDVNTCIELPTKCVRDRTYFLHALSFQFVVFAEIGNANSEIGNAKSNKT